jgi:hypothetical protein
MHAHADGHLHPLVPGPARLEGPDRLHAPEPTRTARTETGSRTRRRRPMASILASGRMAGWPSPASPRPYGVPCYGEDNHYVDGELLGMSAQEIKGLAEAGVS